MKLAGQKFPKIKDPWHERILNTYGIAISLALAIASIAILYYVDPSEFENIITRKNLIFIASATSLGLALVISIRRFSNFLYDGIRPFRKSATLTTLEVDASEAVSRSFKALLETNPELADVEDRLYRRTISQLETSLITKLDDRYSSEVKRGHVIKAIDVELRPLTDNIGNYLDRIARNSVVTLGIGIGATVVAIIVLLITLLSEMTTLTIPAFLIHFLPRLTFVIFIQLFAFFFLRLYKNNLEDAKFFQNELTNINAKVAALKISYLMDRTEVSNVILKEFSSIERNFKLNKDESTIGLEKARLESEMDKSTIDHFKDLMTKFSLQK